jgi:UDP-glucose/iron transport system ATP-binding protein
MDSTRYLLECKHVSRELPGDPGRLLLDDISFHLERSDVLAVLGPSGAGKSSLLRVLNRLDEPTAGQILLDGQDTRAIAPRQLRRRIGMVMQRPYLFPGTVAENIAFGPAQIGQQISAAAVDEWLAQVGLDGYASRNVAGLSGGESQRVSMLRALANQPELLVLDEPTSALDEGSKLAVEMALSSLIQSRQLTCVWVTHDELQARRMAAKALVLEAGRLRAFGQIERVLA